VNGSFLYRSRGKPTHRKIRPACTAFRRTHHYTKVDLKKDNLMISKDHLELTAPQQQEPLTGDALASETRSSVNYYRGLIPKTWEALVPGASATDRFLLQVRHSDNDMWGDSSDLFDALERDARRWDPGSFNFLARIWRESETQGEALGFLCLNLQPMAPPDPKARLGSWCMAEMLRIGAKELERIESEKPIGSMRIGLTLAYVRSEHRTHGIGTAMARGLKSWLHACCVYGPRTPDEGVALQFASEIYSDGGERLARIIGAQFEMLSQCWHTGETERSLGWRIGRVSTNFLDRRE
jgi:hypothetical protein